MVLAAAAFITIIMGRPALPCPAVCCLDFPARGYQRCNSLLPPVGSVGRARRKRTIAPEPNCPFNAGGIDRIRVMARYMDAKITYL
jgi:hypothetical protein